MINVTERYKPTIMKGKDASKELENIVNHVAERVKGRFSNENITYSVNKENEISFHYDKKETDEKKQSC